VWDPGNETDDSCKHTYMASPYTDICISLYHKNLVRSSSNRYKSNQGYSGPAREKLTELFNGTDGSVI
jgi:hypothetical protein